MESRRVFFVAHLQKQKKVHQKSFSLQVFNELCSPAWCYVLAPTIDYQNYMSQDFFSRLPRSGEFKPLIFFRSKKKFLSESWIFAEKTLCTFVCEGSWIFWSQSLHMGRVSSTLKKTYSYIFLPFLFNFHQKASLVLMVLEKSTLTSCCHWTNTSNFKRGLF